jgi:aromatic ring-cleaving dioxygenase
MGNSATAAAPARDAQTIKRYHAHIYYDPLSTREQAARLREQVATQILDAARYR